MRKTVPFVCPSCGSESQRRVDNLKRAKTPFCRSCAQRGERHPNWIGGVVKDTGRVSVRVDVGTYVKRYRLVVEEALGRPLTSDEIVHHINGDPTDDRLENLQVMSRAEHQRVHRLGQRKTHCPQGHEYSSENTYVTPVTGVRVCRICRRENNRRYEQRKRAQDVQKARDAA